MVQTCMGPLAHNGIGIRYVFESEGGGGKGEYACFNVYYVVRRCSCSQLCKRDNQDRKRAEVSSGSDTYFRHHREYSLHCQSILIR